ncbi:MAG: hypothetical protein HY327_12175 [Chloroflexi bacterium]|nr:hypothetical protein [Chloroflexota bacterium]
MGWRILLPVILLALAVALLGCGGGANESVEYRRTGGIAGFDDNLSIAASGKATITRRTGKFEFTLTRDEQSRLYAALEKSDWSALKEDSRPAQLVPDALSYEIAYKGKRVRTADTAIPQSLEPVLIVLNELVDRRGK